MDHQQCVLLSIGLILFFQTLCRAAQKGCSLNVLRNPNENLLPLLLFNNSTNLTPIIPEQGYINLDSGDGITLVCPSTKNTIVALNTNSTFATCIQDTTLEVLTKSFDFDELLCEKTVQNEIQKTDTKCGNGRGKIIYIGYKVTRIDFEYIIKVCYDDEEGTTLYTEHTIHGEEIKYASKSSYRPSFKVPGLGPGVSANVAYKQVFQKSTFNQLLNSTLAAERYITSKNYLVRGHISPDADFLYASSQYATYYYINACPQWNSINGANWVRVEHAIRKTANHYQTPFTIITGTHEILKLPDENGIGISIYLVSGNKLPVPKFVWKIMYDEHSNKGIAFINLNNPFVNTITQDDFLCMNICEQYGWSSDAWNNLTKGFVYCCDINELARNVKSLPPLNVSGVLSGIV